MGGGGPDPPSGGAQLVKAAWALRQRFAKGFGGREGRLQHFKSGAKHEMVMIKPLKISVYCQVENNSEIK